MPDTFCLPRDVAAFERARAAAAADQVWIVKPPNSSCGRGIFLAASSDRDRVPLDRPCVVSKYVYVPRFRIGLGLGL